MNQKKQGFLKKDKYRVTIWANSPRHVEVKKSAHPKTYTRMFTAASFIRAKKEKTTQNGQMREHRASQKEWGSDTGYNVHEPPKHYAKCKKPHERSHTWSHLYEISRIHKSRGGRLPGVGGRKEWGESAPCVRGYPGVKLTEITDQKRPAMSKATAIITI